MTAPEFSQSPKPRPNIGPGTRLNGIYEIECLVGVGGMGEVYKGHAIQTRDPVAIKMIRPEMAQNEAALALFRKEATALHNLYHEAIVRYYVFSVDPDLEAPYLAMEFVDGAPLSQILKRGPLDFEQVRVLQTRLASGLQAAHERGVIHRDISPDNIILPGSNPIRAKIIDFGIARSTQVGDCTVIGSGFAGKCAYVSPEQLGLFGGEVTPTSDIYSLGLVLAEAVSGNALDMGGNQFQVLEKRRRVPDLRSIDSRMRPLLELMLQPNPADRIQTMADIAAWKPKQRSTPRRRWPIVLGGLTGAVMIAAGALVFIPPAMEPSPSPPDPELSPPSKPEPPSGGGQDSQDDASSQTPPPTPPEPNQPQQRTEGEPNTRMPESPTQRLARYVYDYEGGDCFYLAPMELRPDSAVVEGFGNSVARFEAFDTAFRRAHGFEAKINVRLVADAQCPTVAFMKSVGANGSGAPKLQVDSFILKAGASLGGRVGDLGARHVYVLLVGDDGYVYNLLEHVKQEDSAVRFNFRPSRASSQGARPQLIMAVATSKPMALLSGGKPVASDVIFPLLLDEARTLGVNLDLAVKYVHLE